MQKSNLEKYKSDLDKLITTGTRLRVAMDKECRPAEFEKAYRAATAKGKPNKAEAEKAYQELLKTIGNFTADYQKWYSEALAVTRQLIPDRINDLVRLYEKPKGRKDITYENYVIEDYLQGLTVTRVGSVVVDKKAAIPRFEQQQAILESAKSRFDSSLFDIKQLVQADLLDSELDAARLLLKNKFFRAAGAIAGVVIEKHLAQVAQNHNLSVGKKHPTISDFNELLKSASVIEIPQWRFIQHLGDLRNLCDHNKDKEPGKDDIEDLISGTEKITKTIY